MKRPSGEYWVGFYFNGRDAHGKRIKIPLGTEINVAMSNYRRLVTKAHSVDDEFWRKELRALFTRTKKRAKQNGVEFSLTFEDVVEMFDRSGGKCMLGGMTFSPDRPEKVRFRPWMPSLDRIDAFGPYSVANCRLVSSYTNIAINQFGVEHFVAVAREVERNAFRGRCSGGVGNIQFPNLAT